ncbi:hypothetical protein [Dictyobacter formicarum]|uniref:Uncharacterized protein n=1 Tax=Dictyobacter formicarum TaxID=2778368 RepID=A0ABQ3VGJ4_9CHLR|nr:hypothetical protein [Dictyobacter formicarum]GHO85302.1 hypothetical protein KSZ_33080 [Dictyobacter formicarum]
MSSTPLSTTARFDSEEHIALRRVPAVGLLTLVVALITNIMIGTVSYALFSISPAFTPLNLIPITYWTVLGVMGAVLVFAAQVKLTRHPIANFSKTALIVLLISILPVLTLFFISPFPATSPIAIVTLILMHVNTATLCLGMLTSLCSEPDSEAAERE